MTPYKKRLNKYIKRMAEDMQLRNFADATIDAYTYHADKFCQHFRKTADKLGTDQIREYQLFLVNEKKSWLEHLQPSSLWLAAARGSHGFSTKLPSRNRGPSSTSPSASDRRRCPWSSLIKKQATSSHVFATPNIEPS